MNKLQVSTCCMAFFILLATTGCTKYGKQLWNYAKQETKQEIKKEIPQHAVEYAAGAVIGNNNQSSGAHQYSNTPSNNSTASGKGSLKSGVAKVGAAAVGGVAASQLISDNDLTLGNISIGFNKDNVYTLLGKEREITDPNCSGHLRYQYADMEIIITDGRVTGFVSNTARVSTPRGIRQGDSLKSVLNAYGKPYAQSEFNGVTLYEYKMKSIDHKDCLIRFATKDGKVDYISARVLD